MDSIWLSLHTGAKCFLVSSSEKKKNVKFTSQLKRSIVRSWVPLCIIHHHHGYLDGISGCIKLIMVNSRFGSWVNLIQTSSTKMEWGHLSIETISLHRTIAPRGSLPCCGERAMSHVMKGHPRWTGHSAKFWHNVAHWRRKWQATPIFMVSEAHELYKKAKIYDWKLSCWLEVVQYATAEEWREITNSPKNEAAGPKQKQHSVLGVSSGES